MTDSDLPRQSEGALVSGRGATSAVWMWFRYRGPTQNSNLVLGKQTAFCQHHLWLFFDMSLLKIPTFVIRMKWVKILHVAVKWFLTGVISIQIL